MSHSVMEHAQVLTPESGISGARWPQRILVAADGSPATDAAIRAADQLASLHGAAVEVVAVYAPRIPLPPAPTRPGLRHCEAPDRASAARFAHAVRRQLRRVMSPSGLRHRWPLRFHVGDPGSLLVRTAETWDADLVVVGIHQEEPLDERARSRTAICVSRYLTVPLLAVAAGFEAPRRCLVAFPDGREHRPTLNAALALLAPSGRLWVAQRRLEGYALAGILRLADEVAADLIAVPEYGSAGAMRVFLPNVTVPLLSEAHTSVLIVPDAG